MSITVSSTTDSQDQVNLAAGVETVPETPAPETAEAPVGEERPPYEPDEDDDDAEEPEQEQDPTKDQPPKKKGGFQRKIEALERDRERERQASERRIGDLEEALIRMRRMAYGEPEKPKTPEAPQKPVRENYYGDDDKYFEDLSDWKVAQALAKQEERYQQAAREWQAREQQRLAEERWRKNLAEARTKIPDYHEVVRNAHIPISPYLEEALKSSDNAGPLLYELAKNPSEAERLNTLDPVAVTRELGRLEERVLSRNGPPPLPKYQPSKAPEPIRPVGGASGNNVSTPMDQLPYQDFKRVRNMQIARAKGHK